MLTNSLSNGSSHPSAVNSAAEVPVRASSPSLPVPAFLNSRSEKAEFRLDSLRNYLADKGGPAYRNGDAQSNNRGGNNGNFVNGGIPIRDSGPSRINKNKNARFSYHHPATDLTSTSDTFGGLGNLEDLCQRSTFWINVLAPSEEEMKMMASVKQWKRGERKTPKKRKGKNPTNF